MKTVYKTENAPAFPRIENIKIVEESIKDIKSDDKNIDEWFQGYAYRHLHRIAYDLELIRNFTHPTKGHSILEIGSIPLLLSLPLKKLNYNLTCLDLNYERFAQTIKKWEISTYPCDIEKDTFPIETGSYDIILLNEVFEHLRINPIFTFREIKRILKNNGVLFLSTPNLRSIEGLTNLLFRNRAYALCGDIYEEYQKLEKHGHMGHVREYTSSEVISFLENMEFRVEKVIFRGETRALGKFGKTLSKIFPSLRPFSSYIARPFSEKEKLSKFV